MTIALLILSFALLLWGLLGLYKYAPELLAVIIENYDISDIILCSIILLMAYIIAFQEIRLRKIKR